VSPGFAAEALTPAFGMGLDGDLRAKGDRFVGILNGLDTGLWDPANDPDTAAPYSRSDLAGKAACRADLLTRLGFDPVASAAAELLESGARIVVQGSGHPELADPFRRLVAARPKHVALIERFD